MTSIDASDALHAQTRADLPGGVRIMPMGSFRVEKVGSLDELKTKKWNFAAMRPAVLVKDTLVLVQLRSELWVFKLITLMIFYHFFYPPHPSHHLQNSQPQKHEPSYHEDSGKWQTTSFRSQSQGREQFEECSVFWADCFSNTIVLY